jgi:hypothetical protein
MCPPHTRRLLDEPGAAARMTTVYEHVLPAAGTWLHDNAPPRGPCPACQRRDAATHESLATLTSALTQPNIQRAYAHAEGLCLPHLRQALPDTPLAVLARTAVARLAADPPPLPALAGTDDDAPRRARLRGRLPADGMPDSTWASTRERLAARLAVDACPTCLATGQAEHRYLQWLCAEYAGPEPEALRNEPGGFCPRHLRDLAVLDPAVAAWAATRERDRYRTRLARLPRMLPDAPPDPRGALRRVLLPRGDSRQPSQQPTRRAEPPSRAARLEAVGHAVATDPCLICRAVADTAGGEAALLLAALALPPFASRYEHSRGLCLRHVLDLPAGHPAGALVRDLAAAHAGLLAAELREASRKRAWLARHEAAGAESTAWLRTAAFLNGEVFLGGPPPIPGE